MRPLVSLLAAVVIAGAVTVVLATTRSEGVPPALADVVTSAAVESDDDNVLRGRLSARTVQAERLVVTLRSDDHELVVTEDEPSTDHVVPLLGLRPDHEYEVVLGTVDGNASARVGRLATGPLPADLPPVEVTTADAARMAPGLTLFDQVYRPPPDGDGLDDVGFLTVVDGAGEVVWYHRDPLMLRDARRLPDGSILGTSDETGARRIAPTGEVLAEWRGTAPSADGAERGAGLPDGAVVEVPIHSMHHEIAPVDTDGDTLVTLSRVARQVSYDEPLCPDERPVDGPEDVIGDTVAVFDAATGEVVAEHDLFDVLDPLDDLRRSPEDYCRAIWERHFPELRPRDWTHGNAVTLSPDGRTWLVSARQTDALVALRAVDEPAGPAGSLRWQLGVDGDFALTAGRWFWHQHAPEWIDDDTIILYDNGNGRLDADEPFSRAVIYDIDTEEKTATQVWEHVMPDRLFAGFLGDADLLAGPTGESVLVTHGGQRGPCTGELSDETAVWGQVIEVDRDTGEIVFDLRTRDLDGCVGWAIYRAERIEQIHPAGFTVEVVRD